jgi:TRAP-type C4-dicarboxylate transport system permease small subunit
MNKMSIQFGRLLDALALIAALVILVMVLLVSAEVVLRNFGVKALAWTNEVSEYALYLLTLLTAPWLLRQGQHVRIDLLIRAVSNRAGWVLELAADVVGAIVALGLAWYGSVITVESYRLGSLTIKTLVFPEWWLIAPLPMAFLLIAIEFVFRIHRLLKGEKVARSELPAAA